MPVSYTIKKGYAHCRVSGNYSFEETLQNYKAAFDDPRFLPGSHLLMDVFDSNETRTYEEMEMIASLLGSHVKFGRKCALLINPDHTVRYGLARMLSTLAEFRNVTFSIVFNMSDAERFLQS